MNDITTWVERVQRTGDVEAFTHLVARFEDMAFAVAMYRLHDVTAAEDACQDAFLATYLNLSDLKTPAAFPGWFRRVVYKHADRIGRKPTMASLVPGVVSDVSPTDLDGESQDEQGHIALRAALNTLPERMRLITELFYSGEHTVAQVAQCLEVSDALVKKTLYQARRMLRQEVATMEDHHSIQQEDHSMMQARVAFFLHLRSSNECAVTELLTKHPAWVNAQDLPDAEPARWYMPAMGRSTPLLWAVVMGDLDMTALLLRHGADPNLTSTIGMVPLLEAVHARRYELVAFLLDHGADPNVAFPRSGMTPLHVAASRGEFHLIRALLQHGADPASRDLADRTPGDWAKLKNVDAQYTKALNVISEQRRMR